MDRPYHHGDLRSALIAEAQKTLRARGVDGISLRELARAVGVSHGAPNRHFVDKAALLDALVVDGFHRLRSALTKATHPDDRDFAAMLHDVAVGYVRFATDNPALVDLMSASRYLAEASDELRQAREASFASVLELVALGQSTGQLVDDDPTQIGMLLFATLHGVATLANNRMIYPLDEQFIHRAVDALLSGLTPRE